MSLNLGITFITEGNKFSTSFAQTSIFPKLNHNSAQAMN